MLIIIATREKRIYIIIFVILYSDIDIFSDMSTVIYNNYVNLRKAALYVIGNARTT